MIDTERPPCSCDNTIVTTTEHWTDLVKDSDCISIGCLGHSPSLDLANLVKMQINAIGLPWACTSMHSTAPLGTLVSVHVEKSLGARGGASLNMIN